MHFIRKSVNGICASSETRWKARGRLPIGENMWKSVILKRMSRFGPYFYIEWYVPMHQSLFCRKIEGQFFLPQSTRLIDGRVNRQNFNSENRIDKKSKLL